jgi:hypothetical protein
MDYVVVGKPFAKMRRDGKKQRVAKRAHIRVDGKTLCKVENAFAKTPSYTVVKPGVHAVCQLCQERLGREPRLSVLMGEAVA